VPNASLLIMTSPMLIGQVPLTTLTETEIATVANEEVGAMVPHQAALMPLSWSMTQGQSQGQGIEAETQSATARAEIEDEASRDDEIIVQGDYGPVDADPVGVFNEASYRITQDLDEALVEPVAYAYRDGLPDPLRDGLGNVVRNLREPANFLNFLLQSRHSDALRSTQRWDWAV